MVCIDKIWFEDIKQLFCSFNIIPKEGMTINEKLNTISRMILIISIIIAFFEPVLAIVTFFASIVFILIFYYSIESKQIESFENKDYETFFNPLTSKRFCNDKVPITPNDCNYISPNQLLVGKPNPKTNIPPIVAPHSHDLDFWKTSDLVKHSAINSHTNFDLENSGYNTGVPYGTVFSGLPTICERCDEEECQCGMIQQKIRCEKCNNLACVCELTFNDKVNSMKKNYNYVRGSGYLKEGFEQPNEIKIQQNPDEIKIISQKENFENCYDNYKDRLLTQTLQPGVYQKSKIGEPIQSNIGISFTQQFMPTEIEENINEIKFIQQNPDEITIIPQKQEKIIEQNVGNIYDPRFTGYGTSYRMYNDYLLGQPKFFYDDIEAITRPNYITRSKVDIFPWADTYGPDTAFCDYDEHRKLANNAFTDSALLFRTELQERLMRKRNAELWQQRSAPISRQQPLGLGIFSCK